MVHHYDRDVLRASMRISDSHVISGASDNELACLSVIIDRIVLSKTAKSTDKFRERCLSTGL